MESHSRTEGSTRRTRAYVVAMAIMAIYGVFVAIFAIGEALTGSGILPAVLAILGFAVVFGFLAGLVRRHPTEATHVLSGAAVIIAAVFAGIGMLGIDLAPEREWIAPALLLVCVSIFVLFGLMARSGPRVAGAALVALPVLTAAGFVTMLLMQDSPPGLLTTLSMAVIVNLAPVTSGVLILWSGPGHEAPAITSGEREEPRRAA